MILSDIKNYEINNEKNIITKKLDIDENIKAFILINSNNTKIITPITNKIVDLIIDNITSKDIYNKFGIVLENINYFLKNSKQKENNIKDLNIIISIQEKNTLHFSKIGKASCYMINRTKELVEITDKKENEYFDYISTGEIGNNEKIILSTTNIGSFLNSDDVKDLGNITDSPTLNNNLINILKEEDINNNIGIISFINSNGFTENPLEKSRDYLYEIKNILYKLGDNKYIKSLIAYLMILGEKINEKGKIVKNSIFISGIAISTYFLFLIISSLIGGSIESGKQLENKNLLVESREYIRIANENFNNPEAFELNIKKAEELVNRVGSQNMFLNDVANIVDDISIIKKQFNGVEIFEGNDMNIVYEKDFSNAIKILEKQKKLYIISKESISGPITPNQEIKTHSFIDLDVDDEFIDASISGNDILLITKKHRVVRFSNDSNFSYVNVIGQDKWQESNIIETYNSNLYLVNKEGNQIYRHTPSINGFNIGSTFFKIEDSQNMGKILGIGIDGGVYVLRDNLTMIKFFSSPYRIESLVLNKLPQNYKYEGGEVDIIASQTLNYVYLYLNGKIWVFKPNTIRFQDTKSLTYVGQIEGKIQEIIGFSVPRNYEIDILTKDGVYKVNFEIKDDKLMLK